MNAAIKHYQTQQLAAGQPLDRILSLHGAGIKACQNNDALKVEKVLILLNKTLNRKSAQHNPITERLASVYAKFLYCNQQQDFPLLQSQLIKLRNAWQNLR
ncbi:hypothetical protein HR060_02315 [Catenovulum sp. SM1970]|uniref:hypothetical protein n=1 Tax=Marinifaba aquimaris TaxID=2741323 RepID=UPI0015716D89|nr:hypothetical protein [Marinifaba aquimaris]NTS75690.1 hypothetical protein [Marinifaba aquimaris]